MPRDRFSYDNTPAVLATMHGKERVIAPLLERDLALRVELALGLNTDRFGTFSREIGRAGSQLDAARAKIAAAFEKAPHVTTGIASEGSFGPHPYIPFLAMGRELILLIDRETGLELTGHDASPETNFDHAVVSNVDSAMEFAERAKFPDHGLIVIGCVDHQPAHDQALIKDITDRAGLAAAVSAVVDKCGAAFVETDMRAHRNPTRMNAIGRATADLVRRFRSPCPECNYPGFDVTERVPGLPCAWCGEPTQLIQREILSCAHADIAASGPPLTRLGRIPVNVRAVIREDNGEFFLERWQRFPMKRHSNIDSFIPCYDAFLIDQFGTLHDGLMAYPGAVAALMRIRAAGRKVVLLSSSGTPLEPAQAGLDKIKDRLSQ